MPKPLLLKPIIKAISKNPQAKQALAMGRKGLNLHNIDILNLTRSKFDSAMRRIVADSLGLNSAQLRTVLNAINPTAARKAAVTGENFKREIMRHTGKQLNIKQYKSKMRSITDMMEWFETKDEEEARIQRHNPQLIELNNRLKEVSGGELQLPEWLMQTQVEFHQDIIDEITDSMDLDDFSYTQRDVYIAYSMRGEPDAMSGNMYRDYIINMVTKGYHVETEWYY